MLRAELKAYEIRKIRAPQKVSVLSNVVIVVEDGRKAYSYISFSDKFISDVGMQFPQGISEFHPAYLRLVKWPTGVWKLEARYLHGVTRVPLLEYTERPVWLGKTRSKNEQGKKAG